MTQIKTLMQGLRFNIRRCLKFSTLAIMLLGFSGLVHAQPAFYNGASGTTSNSDNPLRTGSNKVQWIYAPAIFRSAGTTGTQAPAGLITRIYFRLGTTVSSTATYTDFTISLGQNQGTATTLTSTTFLTGLTTVFYSASFTTTGATASSWYGITLNTPLNYDPSKSLVFELKVSGGTGNQVAQTTSGGNQRNFGTYAATTGSVTTGLVDFGIDVKRSMNDLSAIGLTNGLNNTCGNASDPIFVQIRNTGVVDIAAGENIPVRTAITGATTATFNKVYNKAIKAGVTDTIHMGNLNSINITGAISLKSSVSYLPQDSIRANDTNVTSKTFLGPSKPTPNFNFTLFCDSVKFTNATTDICSRVTGYRWDFDNGKISTQTSPRHTFNAAGTYNVKLYVFYGAGLRDSITKQVIIYAKPQANFSADNQCFGTAINFSNFSYGTATYRWSFGDATTSTLTNPSRTYTAAGTYSVKLVATAPNNCRDSISKNIVVFSKPIANFSVANACAGSNVNFNNVSTGGTIYSWDLGDGSASGFYNPSKVYSTPGTYGIILNVTSAQGCTDNASRSVTIFNLPVSSFNVQSNCKGLGTTFSNNSTGANTYLWNFGDGTTSTSVSPSKTYNFISTYNVNLTVTSVNGCTNSSTKTATVYPLPIASFSATDVCLGFPTDFTNLSTMPAGGGDYKWRFGDGSTSASANPTYKYNTAGSFDATIIATSSFGCKDSTQTRVYVFAKPTPNFIAADVCNGQPVKFINNSTGVVSQSWDFGDASKDVTNSPTHTYAGPNIYKVVLTVTNADKCTDAFEANVTVKANPELVFFTGDHCLGAVANFTNISVGAATFSWNFGDGDSTTTTQASHTYATAGNYTVKLRGVSSKGCAVVLSKPISVFPRPVPAFTAPTVCYGLTTQFANTSGGATNYAWNFGDGGGSSTDANPTYEYINAGNYRVILTAISSNNCKEELTKTITVAPLPVPIFIAQDICSGVEMKPVNASQGLITSQNWKFGDGSRDTSKSPTKIYSSPGIYTIQLKVSSALGCSDSTSKTILIYTNPQIKVVDTVRVSKGYSARLSASGGTDYLWSPSSSLDNPANANPLATPEQNTRYTVKVLNAFGCSDTANVFVLLEEDFTLEPQNLITPNANGLNDTWKIKGIEFYPTANVMVFDQWGRILLNEQSYKNTWDGTMDGKPLPDGTYFYVITVEGLERQYRGTINILKN